MTRSTTKTRSTLATFISGLGGETAAGVLLMIAALAAIAIANSPLHASYLAALNAPLFPAATFKLNTAHLWINDALMAVFFFVVGLEVKRELTVGELASPEQRRLPVLAAIAGMAIPACVYLAIAGSGGQLAAGWAIPAATDIAFAMGVVGLLGRRVPPSLRLFLLTVAIVDDIGAVAIIALFYTAKVNLAWLVASAALAGTLFAMNRLRIDALWAYALVAVGLWICVLFSGAHPTIAGVISALAIPLTRRDGSDLLVEVEHRLVPWNGFLIIPLFGFANAGVDLRGIGLEGFLEPLPLAIAAGLALGKPIGIVGAVLLAQALGFARKPEGATWPQVLGVAAFCGIGFTMSLFIGVMAFGEVDALFEQVKIGVLAGSLVSILFGVALLRLSPAPPPTEAVP